MEPTNQQDEEAQQKSLSEKVKEKISHAKEKLHEKKEVLHNKVDSIKDKLRPQVPVFKYEKVAATLNTGDVVLFHGSEAHSIGIEAGKFSSIIY